MRKMLLLMFLGSVYCRLHSQQFIISGAITDKQEPLSFATILVKGTTMGTNSNINGLYTLKLAAGNYEIVYQYVGYSKQVVKVNLTGDLKLDIQLKPEGLTLNEVTIKAGEDPSYPIIRKAIRKRKFYLNQVPAYSCEAYIKGLQKIISTPKNLNKLIKMTGGDLSDTSEIKGIIYLSESMSRYYYNKPKEKEIMYSSKVSGDNKSFSFNQLSDVKLNFYNNLIEMGNLSSRPFVSPINENAFLFYRYFLLGRITTEGKTIHKIKVVPKRKTDPCFSGIIYIQDSTWRITSADMMLTSETKINFVDTLYIKQIFAPVEADSIWMPVSLNLGFEFKIFGFKGNGYYNAHIKDYDVTPAFKEGFFDNELLKVEEGANKKDSLYWSANRAVPLTKEEVADYHKKDSTEIVRSTDHYKDSVDRVHNKPGFNDLLLGYTYTNTKKQFRLSLPGIITNGVQYNTIEGLNLSYKFSADKRFEDYKSFHVRGRLRYGFSNKLWGAEAGVNYEFRPESFTGIGFGIKSIAEQYNQQDPVSPLVNSIYSLLLNENFMKMFRETGIEGNYHSELVNGVYFNTNVKYMKRDPLRNTSDLLLIDDRSKLFTSNDPRHDFTHDSMFTTNRAFTTEFTFSFRFSQKFYTLPHQKIVSGSKYPHLSISYKRAFPILNTSANYDLLAASLSDLVKLGLFGNLGYRVRGGGFINTQKLYFMDFKYFLGNQTIFNTNDYLNSFRLLPYYTFSADKWFQEAHAEHHFNGFIINKIPLIKKLKIGEVIGAHFLRSNRLDYYYEVNFGIEKIFKVIRFDYVLGYSRDNRVKQGFTFGINLSL